MRLQKIQLRILRFISAYRLPIVSGLLIGTSYIPFPPWAIFFCMIPLWRFWDTTDSWKTALVGGFVTQFVLNLIGFHWIEETAREFGHIPLPLSLFVLLGFACIAHLYFAVTGAIVVGLDKKLHFTTAQRIGLYITVFAFFEMAFPTIFPWHLGYTWLWAEFPAMQLADIIGFQGLNILTLLLNGLLYLAWVTVSRKRSLQIFTTAVLIFAALNFVGWSYGKEWQQSDALLRVAPIQGNIGNLEKIYAQVGGQYQDKIVNTYLRLTTEALSQKKVDLIVWPETAYPDNLDAVFSSSRLYEKTREAIKGYQTPLLAGGYSEDLSLKKTYNGMFLFDENGNLVSPPYRKTILLAFGEYFPGAKFFPWLPKLIPAISNFGAGDGPTVLAYKDLKIGPQICYEGLYPEFSAQLSTKGAEVFINVTNDSWFGKHFEPYQHLYMTLARAIEMRRPLVRATNTGITTAILASGKVLEQSPIHTEWSGVLEVPYKKNPPHTIYEKIAGFWIWVLAFVSLLLIVLAGGIRRTRLERSSK